jgi:glycosyltransferase involved in cell wall biosynthesis
VKVLFLTTSYPRPDSPVDGVFVREHALAAARGADVRVVHLTRAPGQRGLFDVERADRDPPAWRVRYRRFGRPVSVLAFLLGPLAAWRAFRRAGWEADVIHAHSFLAAVPALLLGAIHRRPVVYTEHWTVFLPENPGRLSPGMRLLARLALRRADVVLAVSRDLAEKLRRLAPRARLRVVPNAVDERRFWPAPNPPVGRDGARLVTAGLLDTGHKGIDVLLRALARLDEPSLRLDVFGDGARRRDYEALARELGVEAAVAFRGLVAKDRLAEEMRGADLFVLASRYENNPCVALEALASGLPVVATRVGGLPEVVDDESGLLTAPGDPAGLAEAIQAALARLEDFDRGAIARRAHERFGREPIARALLAAYEDALRRGRAI